MLSKQTVLNLDYSIDQNIEEFRMDIINKLSNRLDEYHIEMENINYFNIVVNRVSKRFLSDLKLDNYTSDSYLTKTLNKQSKYFPIENNPSIIGNEITDISYDENGIVKFIRIKNYPEIDFISKLNFNVSYLKQKSIKDKHFDRNHRFCLRDVHSPPSLLVINQEGNTVIKSAYSLNGNYIGSVRDTAFSNLIYRRQGNILYIIKDNKIIQRKVIKSLLPIKAKNFIPNSFSEGSENMISDSRFVVIDLETYSEPENNTTKVYAAGIQRNGFKSILYYIDNETLDSNDVIYRLLNELLKPKYKDHTVYCHNFGNYDSLYIIKAVLEYNSIHGEYYKISSFLRKNTILKLTVSIKDVKGITRSITIRDSYPILNDSLSSLCLKFKLPVLKGDFPYKFAIKKNLFYIGNKPADYYYNKLDNYNITPNTH